MTETRKTRLAFSLVRWFLSLMPAAMNHAPSTSELKTKNQPEIPMNIPAKPTGRSAMDQRTTEAVVMLPASSMTGSMR